ncbi:hypothetical protein [Clostridium beijerinckii]|uniref:hypothetical protein n=1 Tax=Clostridium beijerinckii TaxID=1520 RepID=UPI00047DC9A5|nr:hypothetical protein [Clostridium beijerinckii]
MIEFIMSNLNIFIPLLLIFLTIDTFLLAYKACLTFTTNLKISYNTSKSYYNKDSKIAIINLTIENNSSNPIDIIKVKLTSGFKSYLATSPKIKVAYNKTKSKPIDSIVLLENILNNTNMPAHTTLTGYVVFENVQVRSNSKNHNIVVKTSNKVLRKKIKL